MSADTPTILATGAPDAAFTPRNRNSSTSKSQDGVIPSVDAVPFAPVSGQTVALAFGPTATGTPVVLPTLAAGTATTIRVHNLATSSDRVYFRIAVAANQPPVIPTPYTTAGTGGSLGSESIEPGGIEAFNMSAAVITALAAGNATLSAIGPAGSSGTIEVSFGNGS